MSIILHEISIHSTKWTKRKKNIKDRTVPKLHLVICAKFQNDCIRNIVFSLSVEIHYFSSWRLIHLGPSLFVKSTWTCFNTWNIANHTSVITVLVLLIESVSDTTQSRLKTFHIRHCCWAYFPDYKTHFFPFRDFTHT